MFLANVEGKEKHLLKKLNIMRKKKKLFQLLKNKMASHFFLLAQFFSKPLKSSPKELEI